MTNPGWVPPILARKRHGAVSVFAPDNLLREARRQKGVEEGRIPRVCVLDPDGDIVRFLLASGKASLNSYWACYHTDLYDFEYGGISFGILGCAVGAPFAVLVAEEMFACGCELLISVTSSGQIVPKGKPPFFVLIERALRDEGTSYHYVAASEYSALDSSLGGILVGAFEGLGVPLQVGATWTTDAPFRETSDAIEFAKSEGLLAVEMEAAALYAFAEARGKAVVCFASLDS